MDHTWLKRDWSSTFKMTNIGRITQILSKVSDILHVAEVETWARAFDRFRDNIAREPDRVIADVLGTYGGMGSFNDVILYRNGQPLALENHELDRLREELYSLCRA